MPEAARSSSRERTVAIQSSNRKKEGIAPRKARKPDVEHTSDAHAAHFTHFDTAGQAHMVDVAGKDITKRVAIAGGRIVMQSSTLALIREGTAKKGDVLGIA